jgi:predicted RNase H-like HicB family nuclease
MKYKSVLQKSDEGYSASVLGLPGCWSQGATEEEALENENIEDAIREYLTVAAELGREADGARDNRERLHHGRNRPGRRPHASGLSKTAVAAAV